MLFYLCIGIGSKCSWELLSYFIKNKFNADAIEPMNSGGCLPCCHVVMGWDWTNLSSSCVCLSGFRIRDQTDFVGRRIFTSHFKKKYFLSLMSKTSFSQQDALILQMLFLSDMYGFEINYIIVDMSLTRMVTNPDSTMSSIKCNG